MKLITNRHMKLVFATAVSVFINLFPIQSSASFDPFYSKGVEVDRFEDSALMLAQVECNFYAQTDERIGYSLWDMAHWVPNWWDSYSVQCHDGVPTRGYGSEEAHPNENSVTVFSGEYHDQSNASHDETIKYVRGMLNRYNFVERQLRLGRRGKFNFVRDYDEASPEAITLRKIIEKDRESDKQF